MTVCVLLWLTNVLNYIQRYNFLGLVQNDGKNAFLARPQTPQTNRVQFGRSFSRPDNVGHGTERESPGLTTVATCVIGADMNHHGMLRRPARIAAATLLPLDACLICGSSGQHREDAEVDIRHWLPNTRLDPATHQAWCGPWRRPFPSAGGGDRLSVGTCQCTFIVVDGLFVRQVVAATGGRCNKQDRNEALGWPI